MTVLTTNFPETALRLTSATDTTALAPSGEIPDPYRQKVAQAVRRAADALDPVVEGYRVIADAKPEYDQRAVARRRRPTWADE